MFLRDVLVRWNERTVGAASDDGGDADTCRSAPSLLEELATDPEDFAELASVLKLDLQAVIAALVQERPRTPAELIERLVARESSRDTSSPADQPTATAERTTLRRNWFSWGGEVGWGRWTRARGDARVHREAPTPAVRTAMAAS